MLKFSEIDTKYFVCLTYKSLEYSSLGALAAKGLTLHALFYPKHDAVDMHTKTSCILCVHRTIFYGTIPWGHCVALVVMF